jgi:hypothetical protein
MLTSRPPTPPVLITDLAVSLGLHKTSVVRDLRKRGYAVGDTRTGSGQWAAALPKDAADRYVAERLSERSQVRERPKEITP